jgi:FixJ family two-component response regulator
MSNHPTIFVVDDDLIVRSMVSAVVRRDGMEAMAFDSAEAFIEADVFKQPGVLVLDLSMPGMGGLELQERLQTLAPTLPVIILSSTTDVEVAVEAMRLRAVEFVRKPFDADELLRVIQAAVIQNQAMRTVEAERSAAQDRFAQLNAMEQDVMLLLSEGMAELQISQSTMMPMEHLKQVLESLCTKMQVSSTIELVQVSLLVGADRVNRRAA